MSNVIRFHPIVEKRVKAWAKALREYEMYPVATIAVGPDAHTQIFFDYEEYPAEEVHYILESALELLEEEINNNSIPAPRYDIH